VKGASKLREGTALKCARSLLLAAALFTLGLAAACVGPPPLPEEPPKVGERDPYVIGVTDQLQVTVWKNPELGSRVVVRTDGMISVPLLDDVQAEGLTAEELKEVITEALTDYVTNPDVTVVVMGMNSNTVSIMGGVVRSGELPLNKETRVLQAIARAGGFTTWAKKSQVRILRQTPEGLIEYRFDYSDYLSGDAPGTNIVLQAGDTIVVPD
jgi:polysaccharide export outer membrane protein